LKTAVVNWRWLGIAYITMQVILLEESWSELFLLCAVQWSLPMEASPLFAVADQVAHSGGTSSHSGTGSATSGCAGVSGNVTGSGKSGGHHVHSDMRILQEVTTRFKVLQVDPAEFACHKAIVLFKPGPNFNHFLNLVLKQKTTFSLETLGQCAFELVWKNFFHVRYKRCNWWHTNTKWSKSKSDTFLNFTVIFYQTLMFEILNKI